MSTDVYPHHRRTGRSARARRRSRAMRAGRPLVRQLRRPRVRGAPSERCGRYRLDRPADRMADHDTAARPNVEGRNIFVQDWRPAGAPWHRPRLSGSSDRRCASCAATVRQDLRSDGRANARTAVGEVRKLSPDVHPVVQALWCQPKCFHSMADHLSALELDGASMGTLAPPRDVPIVVISSGDQPKEQIAAHRMLAEGSHGGRHVHRITEPSLGPVRRAGIDYRHNPGARRIGTTRLASLS